jgi:hypothetical protein
MLLERRASDLGVRIEKAERAGAITGQVIAVDGGADRGIVN